VIHDFLQHHLLTLLIAVPLFGALCIAALPRDRALLIKGAALGITLIELVLSLHLAWHFNDAQTFDFQYGMTAADLTPWIKSWNIYYRVGVDGISMLLVLMSAITLPLALLGTWNSVEKDLKTYVICLLVLETGMIGVFCALDLVLFYVFWEVMLVPMYFLIGIWGGENRHYAAIKFFLYTMAGSVLMLVALLYIGIKGGSFCITELYNVKFTASEQLALFAAFAAAFAVKVPLFPLHTWLPDAHVQAPTSGSVILAAVLLKMGVYGFYRFCMPLFPQAVALQPVQQLMMVLSVIGIVYGALVSIVQTDIKKLIAYSSVSHMGVVMLGVFSLDPTAQTGALLQMVNHGISTGALFLIVGMIYDRTHTRRIADYSGLAKLMPVTAVFFLLATFASIGVPLTNGFVGEFLTLLGSYRVEPVLTVVGTSGVVLSAVYMLWLVERVFLGPVTKTHGASCDLNKREVSVLAVLVVFIFWIGIYPKPLLARIGSAVETELLIMHTERGITGAN
jgi:NADH-quinone oxidoreductase subunit M